MRLRWRTLGERTFGMALGQLERRGWLEDNCEWFWDNRVGEEKLRTIGRLREMEDNWKEDKCGNTAA